MTTPDDVDTALRFAIGACLDAQWASGRGYWGDALVDLEEAKKFVNEAVGMVEDLRAQDDEDYR